MIIKSLTIQNFRPYKGPITIDFASGEKNITIIEGVNDTGKTSLINAITWCLYNKEPFRQEGRENRWNKAKVKELKTNEYVEVLVEILMEDNQGNDVRFTRKEKYKKIDDFNCKNESKSFTIYRNINGDDEKIESPETYIKNYLPQSLQEYFIFTGEKLTQFMSKKSSIVKEGVHTLYQLDLIENIRRQAKNRETDYKELFKTVNPELSELKETRSQLRETKENDEKTLEENEKQIESYKSEIEIWKKQIGNQDVDAKDIIKKIDEAEEEKRELEKEEKKYKENYSSLLFNNFSMILSNPLLKEFLEKWEEINLDEKDEDGGEDGSYNYSIAVRDLKHILSQGECLCGNKIEEGNDAFEKIEELIHHIENDEGNYELSMNSLRDDLVKSIKNLNNRYPKNIKLEIVNYNQALEELGNKIQSKQIKIKGLNIQLENLDIDFINELKQKIEDHENLILSLIESNAILKENINEYPKILRELDEDIRIAETQQAEKDEYEEKRDFCEEIKIIASEIHDELAEEVHKDLEDKVTEEYKKIHWKPSYKKIIIKDNFEVEILKDDESTISATDPSTGSQIVLALTFMAALNSISKFNLPQIIDTPIASLSEEMRRKVAEELPKYMIDKQMILLVMDTEYTDAFKDGIEEYVGKKYTLKYLNDTENGEGSEETVILDDMEMDKDE